MIMFGVFLIKGSIKTHDSSLAEILVIFGGLSIIVGIGIIAFFIPGQIINVFSPEAAVLYDLLSRVRK